MRDGKPAALHLEDVCFRNSTITIGLVDAHTTPALLQMLTEGQLDGAPYWFGLDELMAAYDTFSDRRRSGAQGTGQPVADHQVATT
jgi:alcohol dehydrogenase